MSFNTTQYHLLQKKCPDCKIVVVTKYQDTTTTQAAINAGVTDIAEAKVQDAVKKKQILTGSFHYHLIGHLQTNKAKEAVALFDMIQSVDSLKLTDKLQAEAKKIDKKLPILLQANFTGEEQKYGFSLRELAHAISYTQTLSHLDLQGCMTMGKQGDPLTTRMSFDRLRHVCTRHQLHLCSMGMSHDRQLAYQAGSTMLRIGSALFH